MNRSVEIEVFLRHYKLGRFRRENLLYMSYNLNYWVEIILHLSLFDHQLYNFGVQCDIELSTISLRVKSFYMEALIGPFDRLPFCSKIDRICVESFL